MFRRYPYWGWLLLSLLLWCINGYQFRLHRQALLPERMAHAVNKDLQYKEGIFDGFAQHEQDFIRRMFADSLTEKESGEINKLPFYLFCYSGDTLKLWNTNTIIPGVSDSALGREVILRNEKGVFIAKSIKPFAYDDHKRLVALFPVVITYPVENNYLKSHFAASDYIPLTTKIISADSAVKGDYPVTLRPDFTVFYLHFNPQDIQKWSPNSLFIFMLILAILASLSWIQLMSIYITRKKSPFAGFITILTIILLFRSLLYIYGLPFNLDTLTFFSPLLYASSIYLSSFGDLCINTLCLLWIVVFITRHTAYKNYFDKIKSNPVKTILAIVLVSALFAYVFLFVGIIKSLVLDSSIFFDVNHFYSINIYTVLGLLVIGAITGISCLVIFLLNIQLKALLKTTWAKYLLLAIAGILLLFLSGNSHDPFYIGLLCWILVFITMLDIPRFTLVSDLLEPHMLFWAVFICAFCTGILQYYNQEKEHEQRKAFVDQQLTPQRDNVLEHTFDETANHIEKDATIKNFLNKPSPPARKLIDHRFEMQYLTGAVNKYQSKIFLFDGQKNGLFNADSTDFNTLLSEKTEAASTRSPNVFYKESILEGHYYLFYIPVYSDTVNKVIGYVIITLDLKKQVAQTVYPELLQQVSNKASAADNGYAYAVYVNDKLITQTNYYPFTTYLKNDTLKETNYAFYSINDVSELHYKIADKRTIVVIHYHSHAIEMITLFSYLFGMQVMLAVIILLYQLYISYFTGADTVGNFMKLTLRRRVHFSMLAIVLLSFIIVGSVTIWFFTRQYRTSNQDKLQSAMQVSKEAVQDYLKNGSAYASENMFDTVSRSARFKDYLTTLANGQTIDINIFDNKGELFAASQDDIYNKGLISNRMRPDAFYQLNVSGKSIVVQNEQVAGLSYLSAYEPLRNEQGVTLGYINVPYFNSEKELKFQISNILVTLINLYAFIFLLSSLITIFITRWITRTFSMIIEQFGLINLQRNERIQWPYDDEIGLLVREYNKMVNTVEENAALLAQSERESAWREMARQVAHEIKNPLTPMKLNIQYLQQAMKNDHPGIKELTEKVSVSIIEQIDNLSYIASEFSNFAKMPEARPGDIALSELLNNAVELYRNDANIHITIKESSAKLYVLADHSQLMRVCTNLLENAKQAIPENRTGIIEVSLSTENNDAIIAIKDNGAGISEEVAKKIFQPYFTTKTSGTGLGLAMTKKIIEFWKGGIWFETVEGEGTTFFIRLPLIKTLS
jgi:two-component system nitrogen regulation sensor histidine kinase NtrY